ncbi:MAG: hypothetical protein ABL921_23930 [Pirellula sp.]
MSSLFLRVCALAYVGFSILGQTDRFLLGNDPSSTLRILRNARESLKEVEIDVICVSSATNQSQIVRENQSIISYPGEFYAFSTDLNDIIATRRVNHFFWGCIGDQSLKLSPDDFMLSESSSGFIQEKSGMLVSVRGGTTGSQVLMYYPSGEDMLPVLEAIPASGWKSSIDTQGKQILIGESDGRVHTLTVNSNDGFPIGKYEFVFGDVPTTVVYNGVSVFPGFPNAVIPKEVVVTMGLKGGQYKMQCEVRDIRKSRIPPGVQRWKEVKEQIGLPNGTKITVEDMRQINFKWQDGEVVRSVDGRKLDALRGHTFWSSSRRLWLVCGFVVILIGSFWTLARWKRNK